MQKKRLPFHFDELCLENPWAWSSPNEQSVRRERMLLNNTTYLWKTEHAFKWKYKSRADSTPLQMIKVTNSSSIHLAAFGIKPAVALHKLRALCFQCFISGVFIYSPWSFLPLLCTNKWIHNFFCLSVETPWNVGCSDEEGSWWTETVKCQEVLLTKPQKLCRSL